MLHREKIDYERGRKDAGVKKYWALANFQRHKAFIAAFPIGK
jgi:hypothetical protein